MAGPSVLEIASGQAPVTPENLQSKHEKDKRKHADHEEYQYLDLVRDIIDYGEHRLDRYVETRSILKLLLIATQDWNWNLLIVCSTSA